MTPEPTLEVRAQQLLRDGSTVRQVAERLHVSEAHVRQIFDRMPRSVPSAPMSATDYTSHPSSKVRAAAARLAAALKEWDDKGRLRQEIADLRAVLAAKQAALRGAPTKTADNGSGPTAKDVRAWATGAGVDCPPVGRVPQHVMAAYEEAHP